MVENCKFAVGMLMVYVIVTGILVLPIIWLPSWISSMHTAMSCDIGSTTNKKLDPENVGIPVGIFFAMCSRTRDMPGGNFTPPPLPANVAKKPLPGQGLSLKFSGMPVADGSLGWRCMLVNFSAT